MVKRIFRGVVVSGAALQMQNDAWLLGGGRIRGDRAGMWRHIVGDDVLWLEFFEGSSGNHTGYVGRGVFLLSHRSTVVISTTHLFEFR